MHRIDLQKKADKRYHDALKSNADVHVESLLRDSNLRNRSGHESNQRSFDTNYDSNYFYDTFDKTAILPVNKGTACCVFSGP